MLYYIIILHNKTRLLLFNHISTEWGICLYFNQYQHSNQKITKTIETVKHDCQRSK